VLFYLNFILVAQNKLQAIPNPKEKRTLLQGCGILVGTRKIRLAMEFERKGWEECQIFKENKKNGNHFLSNLI
jgi:hypothetical protein